jgi:hypothetical protein
MDDDQSAHGLVILTARIRDPNVREQFWSHMVEIYGERVTPSIYEFGTADWDEGLWDEEIQWMSELMEGIKGRIVIWKFVDGKYSRFSIGTED